MSNSSKELNSIFGIAKSLIQNDKDNNVEINFDRLNLQINQAATILGKQIDEGEHASIFTQLEYLFQVKHEAGTCIFNDYEEKRDWFNNDVTNNTDAWFWPHYRNYLENYSSISPTSIDLLDLKTLPDIMNCLSDPKDKPEQKRLRRGLIIGDVQSGKTATYTGLIAKAADAGYKVVILLAGITEDLRRQTQIRIDEGIVGITLKKNGKQEMRVPVGVGLTTHTYKAASYTTAQKDFVGETDNVSTSLMAHGSLVIFVVKKNVSVLTKLYKWLSEQNLDPIKGYIDVPMLLVDDEADNASVNTKKDELNPTKTNKIIRNICNVFRNATYVGFTATPFANVFIDPKSIDDMQQADLFPEHFIYTLEAPSNYVGAMRIFRPDGVFYRNLRYISDIKEPEYWSDEYKEAVKDDDEALNAGPFYYKHKKEWHGELPGSLEESLKCFFLANAIMDCRGMQEKPRSMLINMSRFIKVQKYIGAEIEEKLGAFVKSVKYTFDDKIERNKHLPLYQELEQLWKKHFAHVDDVSFERVIDKAVLLKAVSEIKVQIVNGAKNSTKLNYKDNPNLRVIAVGGLALSRGLTLEGLVISYFYRNTATFDVLMQMGRWFGYRPHYEDIFQVWTSQLSAEWYREIAEASEELKSDLCRMFEQRLTPRDFGIRVRNDSQELGITAANKMRTALAVSERYTFYGNMFDTPYISRNIANNKKNHEAVEALVSSLKEGGYILRYADGRHRGEEISSNRGSVYFGDVSKETILEFMSKLECSLYNPNFNTKNIIEFLSDKDSNGIELWDVAFINGDSNEHYDIPGLEILTCPERAILDRDGRVIQLTSRRRLYSGTDGKICLDEKQIKEAEESWRTASEDREGKFVPVKAYFEHIKDRKPVLVIYLVQPKAPETDENKKDTEIVAEFRKNLGTDKIVGFAIGIPNIGENKKPHTYQLNKVSQELYTDAIAEEEIDE